MKTDIYKNSIILKTLFAPFRFITILGLIILILLSSSIISQLAFKNSTNLLNQEEIIAKQLNISNKINIKIAKTTYKYLSYIFFDLTQINNILKAQFGLKLKIKQKLILPFHSYIQEINNCLKIISLRISNIILFSTYGFILLIIAIIDGLVQRQIRKKNFARESSNIYHKAKFLRTKIIFACIFIYLAMPLVIPVFFLIIPIIFTIIMLWLQTKYYKKYL